jgi:hypothetical protein
MWYIYGALFYAFVFVICLVLTTDELDSETTSLAWLSGFLVMFIWPVGLVVLAALGVAMTLKKMFKKGN